MLTVPSALDNCGSNLKAGSYSIIVQDDANCSITTVSFENAIKPILQTNCIKSGCHNGDNGASLNWSVFANIQTKAQATKIRTGNRSMPANIAPTSLPRTNRFNCLLDSGALNN